MVFKPSGNIWNIPCRAPVKEFLHSQWTVQFNPTLRRSPKRTHATLALETHASVQPRFHRRLCLGPPFSGRAVKLRVGVTWRNLSPPFTYILQILKLTNPEGLERARTLTRESWCPLSAGRDPGGHLSCLAQQQHGTLVINGAPAHTCKDKWPPHLDHPPSTSVLRPPPSSHLLHGLRHPKRALFDIFSCVAKLPVISSSCMSSFTSNGPCQESERIAKSSAVLFTLLPAHEPLKYNGRQMS